MNGKKLVACSMGKEHVIIPDGVKTIGKYAFANCHVKSVIIPDSVTEISESAFSSCSNLETVIFGKNVESIGDKAFGACVNSERNVSKCKKYHILQQTFSQFRHADKGRLQYVPG